MNYLTIKEAVIYTGKSESTLRKLARENKGSKGKGVRFERLKTGYDKITFSEDFLNSYFNSSKENTATNSTTNVLDILHEQLKAKDLQISDLNERLKEAHILVNNLENKIALPIPIQPEPEPVPEPQPKKRRFLFWSK